MYQRLLNFQYSVLISTYWNVNDIETLGTLADF